MLDLAAFYFETHTESKEFDFYNFAQVQGWVHWNAEAIHGVMVTYRSRPHDEWLAELLASEQDEDLLSHSVDGEALSSKVFGNLDPNKANREASKHNSSNKSRNKKQKR